MDFQMLFISSFLKQLVKNGKQMKKTTFCIFDVSVVQSEKNSCPAMYWPETPVQYWSHCVIEYVNGIGYVQSELHILLT